MWQHEAVESTVGGVLRRLDGAVLPGAAEAVELRRGATGLERAERPRGSGQARAWELQLRAAERVAAAGAGRLASPAAFRLRRRRDPSEVLQVVGQVKIGDIVPAISASVGG